MLLESLTRKKPEFISTVDIITVSLVDTTIPLPLRKEGFNSWGVLLPGALFIGSGSQEDVEALQHG